MTFLDELKEKRTTYAEMALPGITCHQTGKIKKMKRNAKKPPKKLLDAQQKKEIVRLMLWSLPTLLQAIVIGVLLLLFRS